MAQRELVRRFYATYQEAHETVLQFIIRFQNLHSQWTRREAPPKDEIKEIFLTALREPLQMTLAVLHFQTSMINQVNDRVLDIDRAKICNRQYVYGGYAESIAKGKGPMVPSGSRMYNVPEPGPIQLRMHHADTLLVVPLKTTYHGPVQI